MDVPNKARVSCERTHSNNTLMLGKLILRGKASVCTVRGIQTLNCLIGSSSSAYDASHCKTYLQNSVLSFHNLFWRRCVHYTPKMTG